MCAVPTHDVDLVNTVGLLYRRVSHPWIQPTLDRKYLGEKIPESSKKQKLNLPQAKHYNEVMCRDTLL